MNKQDMKNLIELRDKQIKEINNAYQIQTMNGNWNLDAYMHGMANAFIFVKAVLEDKDPEYLEAPKVWLSDIKIINNALEAVEPNQAIQEKL